MSEKRKRDDRGAAFRRSGKTTSAWRKVEAENPLLRQLRGPTPEEIWEALDWAAGDTELAPDAETLARVIRYIEGPEGSPGARMTIERGSK